MRTPCVWKKHIRMMTMKRITRITRITRIIQINVLEEVA